MRGQYTSSKGIFTFVWVGVSGTIDTVMPDA
jgi:hypothetical protein